MAEERKLLRVGRGTYDTSFAINYILGRNHLSDEQQRSIDPKVQALVGWLASYLITNKIYQGDLNLAYCEHWGMSKEEALLSLLKAAAILGRKADLGKLKLAAG